MYKVLSILTLIILCVILGAFWHKQVVAPDALKQRGSLPLAQEVPKTTTLLAVGDIMLSRNVGAEIETAGNPNLPFEKTKALFDSADIKIGNLECPLSDSKIPMLKGLIFRCLISDATGLSWAGFNILSTANNHAMDQGLKGLEFTIDNLKSNNILPVGTGKNLDEAWAPALITPSLTLPTRGRETNNKNNSSPLVGEARWGGTKFAFLAASYASLNDNGKTSNDYVARIENLDILKSKIINLKSQGDFVIVLMHAGTEYTRHPNQAQIDFAHAAIDAGADLVIGSHPHWIQEIEVYSPSIQLSSDEGRVPDATASGREVRKGLIFYSLGNFVFDQMWSQDTKEGLMVKFQISNNNPSTGSGYKLQKAELIPVIIENYSTPRLATEEEKKSILKKINLNSDTITLAP